MAGLTDKGSLPSFIAVSPAALTDLEVAFKAYVASERARLLQDKLFLETLKISDIQTTIGVVAAQAAKLASSELDNLLQGA